MYKSPIEIWQSEIEMEMEGEVLKACRRVGVQVDKEELLKALQYDREQYKKGYQDGLNADKWIPCEVDMPKEEYGTYWIAAEMEGYPCFYYCSAVYTSEHGFRTHDIEAQGKIVAWQPIQLYKKEGEE